MEQKGSLLKRALLCSLESITAENDVSQLVFFFCKREISVCSLQQKKLK